MICGGAMFKELSIKNFRNFENIQIELNDKNIIIGMNDVGKSNFLYALRLVFDRKIRFEEICDTDFYQRDISKNIEILVTLDISNEETNDVQKILANVQEARGIEDSKAFFVKLEILNSPENGYIKNYYWGDDLSDLKEIKSKSIGYLGLDDIFNVIYIPSHIEVNKIFNDIRKNILKEVKYNSDDELLKSGIKSDLVEINNKIESLSSVKNIAMEINENLKVFDESYKIKITSQSIVDDLHKQLRIFTYENEGDILFPASGDGRQKKIMYAMLHYFLQKETKKIPLLILEEPENHLFLSAQVDLSNTLFSKDDIKYIFMSSHSAQLMYHIDCKCNIVRIYKSKNVVSNRTISKSSKISEEYYELKKIYVEDMSKGYFADCVLLVEGYSEKLLCDTILKAKLENNKYQRVYVLPVLGTNFKPYRDLFFNLGIDVIIRTDNDIYKSDIYGLKRCYKLFDKNINVEIPPEILGRKDEGEVVLNNKKMILNKHFRKIISFFKTKKIFLAEIDLENDLINALSSNSSPNCNFEGVAIENLDLKRNLQEKKWHNMFIFLKENEDKYDLIYNDQRFDFLKEVEKCLN